MALDSDLIGLGLQPRLGSSCCVLVQDTLDSSSAALHLDPGV